MYAKYGLRRVAKKREKAGSSISSYDWGNIFFNFTLLSERVFLAFLFLQYLEDSKLIIKWGSACVKRDGGELSVRIIEFNPNGWQTVKLCNSTGFQGCVDWETCGVPFKRGVAVKGSRNDNVRFCGHGRAISSDSTGGLARNAAIAGSIAELGTIYVGVAGNFSSRVSVVGEEPAPISAEAQLVALGSIGDSCQAVNKTCPQALPLWVAAHSGILKSQTWMFATFSIFFWSITCPWLIPRNNNSKAILYIVLSGDRDRYWAQGGSSLSYVFLDVHGIKTDLSWTFSEWSHPSTEIESEVWSLNARASLMQHFLDSWISNHSFFGGRQQHVFPFSFTFGISMHT